MILIVASRIVWVNYYIAWQAMMWIPKLETSNQPKYQRLVEAIAQAIESGELKVGDRLPPQRQLAWRLGINPSTTMQAYREAARRHLVGGEVGRGTFVLAGSKEVSLFLLKNRQSQQMHIDLSTNVPVIDPHNQNIEQTLQTLMTSGQLALTHSYLSAEMLMLGQVMGAKWMGLRGMECLPQQIKLCAGAQQGILAVLLSLCQSGETLLVEQLTAPGIKAAARDLRLPLQGIAMDQHGIIAEELDRLVRASGAKVVVLTPILQNPTATTMSEQRKREVAQVIRKHDLVLVEDDVYGGLTDIPPLAALLPDNSLLITSFSKTVSAGLRIGFIVGSDRWLKRIDPDSQITSWAVSPLSLLIANGWINDGTAEQRLHWQRAEVSQRWRLARKILGSSLLTTDTPAPHIWLETGYHSQTIIEACRAVAVDVVPAEVFSVKRSHSYGIRISLTAAKSQVELKIALERIAAVLMSGGNSQV